MASWLVCSTPERAVRVRALAGDIVLCSWARHFTPTVPLSTQVYKWVPANLMLGVTLRWTSIPSRGGVEILSVTSCYGNRDKLQPDGPLGSNADFTLPFFTLWFQTSPPPHPPKGCTSRKMEWRCSACFPKPLSYLRPRSVIFLTLFTVARNSFNFPQTSFTNSFPNTVWFILSVWNLLQT